MHKLNGLSIHELNDFSLKEKLWEKLPSRIYCPLYPADSDQNLMPVRKIVVHFGK